MRRGSVVLVQQPGTVANKARPCLIVQNELALGLARWVTMCPITSHLTGAATIRIPIEAASDTGLLKASEVEVDMIFAAELVNIAETIGQAPRGVMIQVDASLKRWLDL